MFIESSWQEAVVALLTAINAILGAPDYRQPIRPFVASDLPTIALSLQDRSYRPASWFIPMSGQQAPVLVSSQAPAALNGEHYDVLVWAIEPSGYSMLSSRSGGILYLDPFYALLASFNLGRFGRFHAEVRVTVPNLAQPWNQRQAIVEELEQGSYRPDRYFALADGASTAPGEPAVTLGNLSSQDLAQFKMLGRSSVRVDARGSNRYLLYRYVAP
jgi:hypothetical protein